MPTKERGNNMNKKRFEKLIKDIESSMAFPDVNVEHAVWLIVQILEDLNKEIEQLKEEMKCSK